MAARVTRGTGIAVLGVVLALCGGTAFWMYAEGINPFRAVPPYPALPQGVEIAASDGAWIATGVDTTQHQGAWRVRADLYAKAYDLVADEMTYEQRRQDLCETVLASLPQLGIKADRGDIFRVEVKAFVPRGEVFHSVDRVHEPVGVRDGACLMPRTGLRYAGDLMDWQLTLAKDFNEGARLTTMFSYAGQGASPVPDFP
jgi:hypothetical protein